MLLSKAHFYLYNPHYKLLLYLYFDIVYGANNNAL